MSSGSELESAKKNISNILGESMKTYLHLLKSWFKQKLSREEFDAEARKLMPNKAAVHLHNQFLLAIMTKCSIMGMSSTVHKEVNQKIKKPKKTVSKISSQQQHFAPANPLSAALHIVCKVPEPDQRNIGFASRELTIPDMGMVHGRMIVTAWDFGIEDIEDNAVKLVFHSVEVILKNILTAACTRRSGYKIREGRFKHVIGTEQPNALLRTALGVSEDLQESEATSISMKGLHTPSVKRSSETSHRDAAMELSSACDVAQVKTAVSLFDLYEALQVYKSAIPSHSIYTTNMERMANKLWHPSNRELMQENVHRQETEIKRELHAKHKLMSDDKALRIGYL